MKSTRTENTIRNIIFSYVFAGVTFLFQFISRSVIVTVLGEQYLGLSSLFTSILHVLNMAELGFSGAIVFNMYKPLAEGDKDAVCALLKYYRDIYRRVGTCILVIGLFLAPFIPKLIKGTYPKDINIYALYFLYLINTGVSYFLFAYKDSLLHAVQRMDLSKIAYTVVSLGQYVLQILALVVFKNYYLFVVFQIVGTISKNIAAAYLAKKYFPQYECKGEISPLLKKEVLSRVKGLLICNISGVTYTTFDSIILSSCVGLTSVAIYGNYMTVFSGVSTILSYIRSAMQASVGNSVATESVEKNKSDLFLWQYLFSIIALWVVTCMFNLYQPFMTIWMGNGLLLSMLDVGIICAWFAITVVQFAYFLYLSGCGLWWELRWSYITSTFFNLLFNIILGKKIGVTGILLSSLLATFIFGFLWQENIVFKIYFHMSRKLYTFKQMYYFALTAISCYISWLVCKLVDVSGIAGLIVRGLVCTLVSVCFIILCGLGAKKESKKTVQLAKKMLNVK